MSNPYQPPQQPPYPQQPQQQSYPPQPSYQQPSQQQPQPYPPQPYPTGGGYGQGFPQPAPTPVNRGKSGLIGLIIVLVALIAGGVVSYLSVDPIAAAMESASRGSANNEVLGPLKAAGVYGLIYLVICLIGTTGWVFSIIGTVKKAVRPAGIAGIVVGVLAIPIHYALWAALIYTQIPSLS